MANPNQSVRTCILKVDLKCCTGCQKKASTRLQSLFGVTAAEYNAEKGLMTVTGDVKPMALVNKLTKCGRKTELVSVNYKLDDLISDEEEEEEDDTSDTSSSSDTSSEHDPKPMKRETQVKNHDSKPMKREAQVKTAMKTKKKEGILRKYLLLGCCRSKPKVVQPFIQNRVWQGSSRFGSGPPPFQMMQAQGLRPMMMQQQQQQPQVPMTGAAMQYNNMPCNPRSARLTLVSITSDSNRFDL
ncbi:hypothetical protein EUTSA_v10009879mg [Eutrema salsugineum]|uniref:HMA domain-containing protein n=1 Tax=Eutrema salsugineum TaxID=72664 RepID=V4KUX5_EUTSA|nr:hypothetical protein EUTSA_v10009879mg [Eutrema salsugineum]